MIHGLRYFGAYTGQPGVGPLKNVMQVCEHSPLVWKKDENDNTWLARNNYHMIDESEYNKFYEDKGIKTVAGDVTGDSFYGEEDKELITMWNDDFKVAKAAYEAEEKE